MSVVGPPTIGGINPQPRSMEEHILNWQRLNRIFKVAGLTQGDTLYVDADGFVNHLAIGTSGKVLTVSAGLPVWAAPSAGAVGLGNVTNDAQLKIASNLSDLNNATTARTNLGLGTAATSAATAFDAAGAASTVNTALGTHTARTDNPHSVTKTQVGLSAVTNDAQLKIASNLSDLANAATSRSNLGLGTSATVDTGTSSGQIALNSNGSGLAQLNASNLSSGTVGTARLGSGSATAATFLRGDNTWGALTVSDLPNRALFDHYADAGNTTTTETDLYSDTIAAGQLGANGDKLEAEYGGVFVSSATATRQVKIYFAGSVILDTGALTLSLSSAWTVYVTIIRVSATVVRYMCSLTTEGAALAAYTAVGALTGLTLSGTNILKVTGQAAGVGAATNDIVAKMGCVEFKGAA